MHLSTANENDQRGCRRVTLTSPKKKPVPAIETFSEGPNRILQSRNPNPNFRAIP